MNRRRRVFLTLQWWCFGLAYRVAYFAYFSFVFGMAAQFALSVQGLQSGALFSLSNAVGAFVVVCGAVSFPLFSFIWLNRHSARAQQFLKRTPFTETQQRDFQKTQLLQQGRLMAPYHLHYLPHRRHFGQIVFFRKLCVGVLLGAIQFSSSNTLGSLAASAAVFVAYLICLAVLRPYHKVFLTADFSWVPCSNFVCLFFLFILHRRGST